MANPNPHEQEIDALFALELSEFTSARDALARTSRRQASASCRSR
jgi:hypothetical protein